MISAAALAVHLAGAEPVRYRRHHGPHRLAARVTEVLEEGVAPFEENVVPDPVAEVRVRVIDLDRDPVAFVERWRAMREPQTNLLWSPDSLMNFR